MSENQQNDNVQPCKKREDFENELRKAAEDWFRERGYKTQNKRYILAEDEPWRKNIICKDVVDYIKKKNFSLHSHIHNGLSSQAMVFNLIGPLIVRNGLDPLKIAMERNGIEWPSGNVEADFEYEDQYVFNEKHTPTSIDLKLSGTDGSIFIEAKLKEQEFGGCSFSRNGKCKKRNPYPDRLDECYLHRIGIEYWRHFEELGFSETDLAKGAICPFASYYQFFRVAMFAFLKNGSFVLLHDERNPAFWKSRSEESEPCGLWSLLSKSIPKNSQCKIGRLTIQDVVKAIQESGRHEDWIGEFKKKYGIQ